MSNVKYRDATARGSDNSIQRNCWRTYRVLVTGLVVDWNTGTIDKNSSGRMNLNWFINSSLNWLIENEIFLK